VRCTEWGYKLRFHPWHIPAFTFFSSDRKHTTITRLGTGTWRIAENDSNFGGHGPFSADAPGPGQGSFRTTLTIPAPSSG
jgi:hypothetical protein